MPTGIPARFSAQDARFHLHAGWHDLSTRWSRPWNVHHCRRNPGSHQVTRIVTSKLDPISFRRRPVYWDLLLSFFKPTKIHEVFFPIYRLSNIIGSRSCVTKENPWLWIEEKKGQLNPVVIRSIFNAFITHFSNRIFVLFVSFSIGWTVKRARFWPAWRRVISSARLAFSI